jgi:hypothetical protein
MDIQHKYKLLVKMAHVGIGAILILAVIFLRYYRPLYDAVDIVVVFAVGMMLGAVYVRSEDILWERFTRAHAKQEEAEKKAMHAEPNSPQETNSQVQVKRKR